MIDKNILSPTAFPIAARQESMQVETCVYHSPCGTLLLGACKDRLCLCDWSVGTFPREVVHKRLSRYAKVEYKVCFSGLLREAVSQLNDYFQRKRTTFSIPLLCYGTCLQQQVWQQLQTIPYGRTLSYAELATGLGMPSAVRAVANANAVNAISIFIPCHRVVGSNGALTGYAGGLEAKRYLLALESGVSSP